MKSVLAQLNSITGDIQGNVQKIISAIQQAKKKHADLIAFPELTVTGYCLSDLIEDRRFLEKNKIALEEIQKESNGIIVIVGFIDFDITKINNDGKIRKYNAAAVFQDGILKGLQYKSLLPNYRYFDDKRYFSPAEERTPIPVTFKGKDFALGISICEDMWDDSYSVKPIEELTQKGAQIIINLNASPFFPGKIRVREQIILRHIKNGKIPFLYVNTIGAGDNGKNIIPFDGESLAYNAQGTCIARGKQFEEELLFCDLENKAEVKKEREHREKEIYEALVMSVQDYGKKTGFSKAILPLSGGIDSALGLAIAVDAFGSENVLAYNLPSKYNTATTKSIAEHIAKNLGVIYKVIPIQSIDEEIRETFQTHAHTISHSIAKENLHARIRGILMMLESNDTGALLISNGNETEIALGYSTLYGDMCGGISVIGDLSKMDVYRVAAYVNEKYGREIIPRETFTIKPSAELSEGQYDPFDYDVVAPLVGEFVDHRKSPQDLIESFRTKTLPTEAFRVDASGKTVYDKYTEESFTHLVLDTYKLFQKSVYKRLQGPPIIAVSERAFGFDLRETIMNRWRP